MTEVSGDSDFNSSSLVVMMTPRAISMEMQ